MEIVERYAERVLAFYDGTVIADGPPAQALHDDQVKQFVVGETLHRRPGRVRRQAGSGLGSRCAMLRVSNVDARIGPVPILYDVGLALDEGEMGGLIGRNGAGKTTFMRALMGLVPATGRSSSATST